jgi:hypothetical protein
MTGRHGEERSDDLGGMHLLRRYCFAEFILGLAEGETRGPAMTRMSVEGANHAA